MDAGAPEIPEAAAPTSAADGTIQLTMVSATDEPKDAPANKNDDEGEEERPPGSEMPLERQPQPGQPEAQPDELADNGATQQRSEGVGLHVPQLQQPPAQQDPLMEKGQPVMEYDQTLLFDNLQPTFMHRPRHPHHTINLSMVQEELSSRDLFDDSDDIEAQQRRPYHPLKQPPLIPGRLDDRPLQSVALSEITNDTSEGPNDNSSNNELAPSLPPTTNLDLELGIDHRCYNRVSIRSWAGQPMNTSTRRRNKLKRGFQRIKRRVLSFDEDSEDDEEQPISIHGRLMVQQSVSHQRHHRDPRTRNNSSSSPEQQEAQYRLTAMKNYDHKLLGIPGAGRLLYDDTETDNAQCTLCPCCCSDQRATRFLHWAFRSPFPLVVLVTTIGCMGLTYCFAFFIWLIGKYEPSCITGPDPTTSHSPFLDAWNLSWTTFLTTGYGNISPTNMCTQIAFLTAFESFTGVMFSSLCAALIFAKITRAQGFAQVQFSDIMVIRYGTGVAHGNDDCDNSSNVSGDSGDSPKRIPCPVLEFRIFNRRSAIKGGEVIDATVNMVASIDALQADPSLMRASGRRRKGKKGKKKGPTRPMGSFGSAEYSRSDDEDVTCNSPVTSPPGATPPGLNDSVPRATQGLPSQQPARGPNGPHISPMPDTGGAFQYFNSTQPRRRIKSYSTGQGQTSVQELFLEHGVLARDTSGPHHLTTMPGTRGAFQQFSRTMSGRIGRTHSTGQGLNSVRALFSSTQHRPPPPPPPPINVPYSHAHAFEVDQNGKLKPKKVIAKLDVDCPDHPFFARAWLLRHTLDMSSPILKPNVRQLVAQNNGFWPRELNTHESIRSSIQFDQILVNLSGTSNADANSVYAHHVYHMIDVNIGYRFVDVLYRHRDGTLRADGSLLNDVMEQAGGGGEPFQKVEENTFQDMLVL